MCTPIPVGSASMSCASSLTFGAMIPGELGVSPWWALFGEMGVVSVGVFADGFLLDFFPTWNLSLNRPSTSSYKETASLRLPRPTSNPLLQLAKIYTPYCLIFLVSVQVGLSSTNNPPYSNDCPLCYKYPPPPPPVEKIMCLEKIVLIVYSSLMMTNHYFDSGCQGYTCNM